MKKKKFIFYSFVAFCALVAAFGIYQNSNPSLSDLALANIEALANDEQYVKIPCVVDPSNFCEYDVMLADGTTGTRIDYGLRYEEFH